MRILVIGGLVMPSQECVHFLTMQLVEGQALDRAIPEGGLPVERSAEIAMSTVGVRG